MSQWTSSFSLIGATGPTGPAGSYTGNYNGDILYYSSGTFVATVSSVKAGAGSGELTQEDYSVAIGVDAGHDGQDAFSVAIGNGAGFVNQSTFSVAIGHFAGASNQYSNATAIGASAGTIFQMNDSVAIGNFAGYANQSAFATAIGSHAGDNTQGSGAVAIGNSAGQTSQGAATIAIGQNAGNTSQGASAVAIGDSAGRTSQGTAALAIGGGAGYDTQGASATAVGNGAGYLNQGTSALAFGNSAGYTAQGTYALAVGNEAGSSNQGNYSVAIGHQAGQTSTLGQYAVAIGSYAGQYSSNNSGPVAVGSYAGYSNQGQSAVAIGQESGYLNQGGHAIGIGLQAGGSNQGAFATSMGYQAGNLGQSNYAVAIGFQAGCNAQGTNAIAIGNQAGNDSQTSNSIVLNASGAPLTASTIGLYIDPIREVEAANQFGLYYDIATKEVIYNSIITISSVSTVVVAGNIVPSLSETFTLGTSTSRYTALFVGPGSLNIAGPSNASATIGTDAQGIVYTEGGFATPFVNIGPAQLTPQAVGGWQIGPTGTQGATGYDLVIQQQQANGSGPTGPAFSLIRPIVKTFGNTLSVDAVNGNDATASPGFLPYSTIDAAIAAAVAGDTIWVCPGTYTLSAPITLPANTSMRGMSVQTCKIQFTATTDTTMITMGENTRIEDLSITLTSASDVALVGIGFPGTTAQTAKVRTCVVTVDNRTVTATKDAICCFFYGSNVSSSADFSFNALKGSTLNVYSKTSGRARGIFCVDGTIVSTRDMNIYVSSFTAQTNFFGVESQSTATIQLRTTSVSGTNADISQTSGSLQIGPGTDLINRTANSKSFSTSVYPTTIFYGLKGNISDMTSTDGWLWPGTVGIQKAGSGIPAYPDTAISYFRVQQPAILWGMTTDAASPPGGTHSTIFVVYVSTSAYSTATPTSFVIGYGNGDEGVRNNYSQSVSLKSGDRISLYISTSGALNTNTMDDVTVQLDLF